MPTLMIVLKKVFPIAAGAAIGYVYWHFLGCRNGCMITGAWHTSTLYGALVGATFLLPGKKAPAAAPGQGDSRDSSGA
ncbi:MAG: hypothetical protein IPP94_14365 [Ignavibacteria bacterium]|nr:hypothetical protein [Ignavibacteria bacterium]